MIFSLIAKGQVAICTVDHAGLGYRRFEVNVDDLFTKYGLVLPNGQIQGCDLKYYLDRGTDLAGLRKMNERIGNIISSEGILYAGQVQSDDNNCDIFCIGKKALEEDIRVIARDSGWSNIFYVALRLGTEQSFTLKQIVEKVATRLPFTVSDVHFFTVDEITTILKEKGYNGNPMDLKPFYRPE